MQNINNWIAKQVRFSEGRIIGFGTLHPDMDGRKGIQPDYLIGVRGVKLHPISKGLKQMPLNLTRFIHCWKTGFHYLFMQEMQTWTIFTERTEFWTGFRN